MRLTKTTQQYIAGESRSAVMFGSREVACANCGQTLDALKIINGAYDPVPSTGPKITSGTIALITLAAMAAVIAVGLPDEPLSTRPLYPSRHFRLGGVITESPFEAFAKLGSVEIQRKRMTVAARLIMAA